VEPLSFSEFLGHCRSYDPGHPAPRPIPDWPHVRRLAEALAEHDRLLVLKSRQMMATWIGCAWLLHRALTEGPGVHLVLSKEERSARELVDRIRFLHQQLQGPLRAERVKLSRTAFELPEREVRVLSLPASPHAVRGLSPRTVLWDEMAFARYDEEIWTAVKPAVDAGGRFVGVSTPNGPSGVFARLVHDGSGAFAVHRIHYRESPERGPAWEEAARAGLSAARWQREQELSFLAAEGRVYDQFDQNIHIVQTETETDLLGKTVYYRAIDFGYRRPAVLWAAEYPDGTLLILDELLGDRWPLSRLLAEMEEVDRRQGLAEEAITHTAVDPAGAGTTDYGISPAETLRLEGYKLRHRPSGVAAGVERVRELLVDARGQVRLLVHARCRKLVEAFGGYEWAEDGEQPRKDGLHDHLMDALRYLVVNLPRFQRPAGVRPPRVGGLPPSAGPASTP
jgi:hypothetical protein